MPVSIKEKIQGTLRSVSEKTFSSKVFHNVFYSSIKNKTGFTKTVKASRYPITKISNIEINVKPTEVLPFRVKFTTVSLTTSYGPGNPAPIGIAVIGLNNYIL
jgi:hypothetical protein